MFHPEWGEHRSQPTTHRRLYIAVNGSEVETRGYP